MTENNPMLEELERALEDNPFFGAVADQVAREMLDAKFADAMNAHPDVATVEGRWLGTLKRLVCNTILRTFQASTANQFSAKYWAMAEADMEHYHSQVQGFAYDDPANDTIRHVVRDLTLPRGQEIWAISENTQEREKSEEAAKAEYERCHTAMMRAIRERQISMTWTHYTWRAPKSDRTFDLWIPSTLSVAEAIAMVQNSYHVSRAQDKRSGLARLKDAAHKLRNAQKAYMECRGDDRLGQEVAKAAQELDDVLSCL